MKNIRKKKKKKTKKRLSRSLSEFRKEGIENWIITQRSLKVQIPLYLFLCYSERDREKNREKACPLFWIKEKKNVNNNPAILT